MAIEQFANNAQTTLNGNITNTATTLTVASATGFPPAAQFRIIIDNELMLVTGGAGTTTWAVMRHIENTSAAAHTSGTAVTHVLTAGGLENLDASYIATGTLPVANGGTGISTGTPGGILGFTGSTTIVSSSLLTANGVVLGGGSSAAPSATAAGSAYQVLAVPSGGGAPAFGAINVGQSAAVTGTLPVANGGTGITAGTAGGILGFTGSTTVASSGLLAANGVVLGGGSSATPTATAAGSANQVFCVPSGGNPPAFGSLDLSKAATVGTSVLGAGNGGTGQNTLTAHGVVIGNGTGNVSVTATGSSGQVLTSNGSSSDPTFQPLPSGTPQALLATVFNLYIANNATTPNTKIDIKPANVNRWANYQVNLQDTSSPPNVYKADQSSTITIDAGTTGANGLDTSTQGASTWYYIWLIYNGTTVAGLLSTSSTSPTMPSGYTYKALLGAIYSNASTHFVATKQYDRRAYTATQNVFTATAGVTSFTSQSLANFVPPIATHVSGTMGTSTVTANQLMAVAGDVNGIGEVIVGASNSTTTLDGYKLAGMFVCPMFTAQTLYWKTSSTASNFSLDISGWEL